ncbi:MAG: fused MFS/spermidine synthase [Nitrospinota bacterium]|nr:fused MFS/spermidine synthase [Nitrospinota bacterium]
MNSKGGVTTAIYLAFFFSGAVGLAYEVVWARQLSLLFGVSIYAVSAVLVAFMGGLGAGAEFFGRKLNEGMAPARLYAALEVALGAYLLLFPLWLLILEKVYIAVHPGADGASPLVILIRFILAVGVLIVPATLMGGTLPALSRYFAEHEEVTSGNTGRLYAVNTLGAMAGCILAGFWMIETFGLTATLRTGAVINIILGATIWGLAGEKSWFLSDVKVLKTKKRTGSEEPKIDVALLAVFGISGFTAMGLQVLWTRMLVLLLNNTTYAFALILAIFLLGIGLGSALGSRFIGKEDSRNVSNFAFFQIGIGLFALLSMALLAKNADLIEILSLFVSDNGLLASLIPGGKVMASAILFALIIVFPCTFLMGAGFPLVVKAYASSKESLGGDVGRVYAVNTIGCVLGALAAGYLFIPVMGIHKAFIFISWLVIAGGGYLIFSRSPKLRVPAGGLILLILAPFTALLLYAGDISYFLSIQKLEGGSVVEYYEEGASASVLVSNRQSGMTIASKPVKRLWINGDPIAGSFRDALQLERLQAHIPLLLHNDPKEVLVICFGTGSTAGAVSAHRVEKITAVDISREVFNAGESFAEGNLNIMKNEKLRLVEEDGRNFLLTTRRKFDFITAEPPPPSNAGIISLYTKEFYELCKLRLKKGGIVSQWIPLHHLSESDFRSLVATFHEVFPNTNMWYTKWDAIMVGSVEKINLDFDQIAAEMKNPFVAASLGEIGIINPYQLLATYMTDSEGIRAFTAGAKSLVDDHPITEFSAPRAHLLGLEIMGRNLENLLKTKSIPNVRYSDPEDEKIAVRYMKSQEVFYRGRVALNDNRRGEAASFFEKSLEIEKENSDSRFALINLNLEALNFAVAKGKIEPGLKMLDDTRHLDIYGWFKPQLHFLNGMLLAGGNRTAEAEAEFKKAISLDSEYFLAIVNLAGLYGFRMERHAEAKDLYLKALQLAATTNEQEAILKAISELTKIMKESVPPV